MTTQRVLPLITAGLIVSFALGQDSTLRQEESADYYRKWLQEDVQYIISDEEKEIFQKLSTDDERDQFIEQFWFRRDPDPRTAQNEIKEEHYRRIAYANEKFGSGVPGWKSDRGRTYITFGPPDVIEDHPSGGWYYRPMHEGGGGTSTYPFQLWIYNFIEGVGDQVEVEFVDPSWSGEYRMALEPWEKDALLHVTGGGPTALELEGRLSKRDRPYFSPGNLRNTKMQNLMGMRAQDKPFERMIRFFQLQKPEPIEYRDLKQLVETRITYQQIPFQMGYDYLIIDPDQVLVPITLEFENRDLSFAPATGDSGILTGKVGIYAVIQAMNGRIVTEFDDALALEFPESEKEVRQARKSVYQRMILLPPGRYKMTLAVRDERGDRVSTLQTGLILPAPAPSDLDASSIILARSLQFVEQVPSELVPFVLGDFKVIPNVTRRFNSGDDMGIYVQVYNAAVDQATSQPGVEVQYQLLREGRIVKTVLDPKNTSVFNYGDRILLLQALDLNDLEPGGYILKVQVHDRLENRDLVRETDFEVIG